MRLRRTWDWSGAEADFERALNLNASDSTLQWRYAALLGALGRRPQAVAAARKATELDPLSGAAWTFLTLYLIEDHQFPVAHEALRHLSEIAPDSPIPANYRGVMQLLEGDGAGALSTFRKSNDLSGVVMAEHTLGHDKEAQRVLMQVIAHGAPDQDYGLAEIYAWLGEKDKAFEALDRALRQRTSDLYDFRNDALLASLRGDPRFAGMLKKMNLPQ